MCIFAAGYWGDIVVSPYIAYGVECDDQSHFERANKQLVSDSEQITKHNLTSLLHELQSGEVISIKPKKKFKK